MPVREVQTMTVPFTGIEVEVDPIHVVHLLLALTLGITLGSLWGWFHKEEKL